MNKENKIIEKETITAKKVINLSKAGYSPSLIFSYIKMHYHSCEVSINDEDDEVNYIITLQPIQAPHPKTR